MNNDFRPARFSRGSGPSKYHSPALQNRLNSPEFKPPEQVESEEEKGPDTSTAAPLVAPKKSFKEKLKDLSKKQRVLIALAAVLVLGGGGLGAYFALQSPAKPTTHPKSKAKAVAPQPTTVPSTLTGLPVDPAVNERPVTAVMIENSTDARPQSGLEQGGVVFDAIAEGGINRFMALYQDTLPTYIGPVRSVRPYYLQWALGFDASVAHVGGSPEALADVKAWGVKDLDQFANSTYYQRIGTRFAPHNVYSNIPQLIGLEGKKGYGPSKYTGFMRKPEQPSKAPTARSIDLNISGASYNSHYEYNQTENNYKRFQAGAPHMVVDQSGNQVQLSPKVVIALVMQQGIEPDDKHTAYTTLGSGHMFVFQDGTVTEGTWHKDNNPAQFTFTDAAGQPIKLNPGQTWLTVVGQSSLVAYKP